MVDALPREGVLWWKHIFASPATGGITLPGRQRYGFRDTSVLDGAERT
jgi:hypothetical protein